jgi:hypothetical protein
VIALSLAAWHVIMQGFHCIFHVFKPAAEDLPISTPGGTFTPKYESISTDPEIGEPLPSMPFNVVPSALHFL